MKTAFSDAKIGKSSIPFLGLVLGTLEAVGGKRDQSVVVGGLGAPGWRARKTASPPSRPLKWSGTQAISKIADTLAAVGHRHRLIILRTLLDGPAVYRTLQKVTGLKAGPLYHHIHQLRMASLILPKQRDLYELSRAGRNMVLIALGIESLLADVRRRPVGEIASP